MRTYLDGLVHQFAQANGIKNIDINSEQFIKDFSAWLNERQIIGIDYSCFLRNLGFNYNSTNCVETDKGEYDSVVKNYDTTIISQAAKTFKNVDSSRLIDGMIRVNGSTPVLVYRDQDTVKNTVIPSSVIQTYMTQNPYSIANILGWESLHNSGNNGIIVGVYGNLHDKDIESQIKRLITLRNKLTGQYREEYETSNDSYYYVIGTNNNIKELLYEKNVSKPQNEKIEKVVVETFNYNNVKKLQRTR